MNGAHRMRKTGRFWCNNTGIKNNMFGTSVDKRVACLDLDIFKMLKGQKVIDMPRLERLIKEYGVYCQDPQHVDKESAHLALNLIFIKGLWNKYKNGWLKAFLASERIMPDNPLITTLRPENFKEDEYFPLELKPIAKLQLQQLGKAEPTDKKKTVQNGKELEPIDKNNYRDFKGAHINLYCRECKTKVESACKNHKDKVVYQARIYVPGSVPRRDIKPYLKARYPDEAVNEVRVLQIEMQSTEYTFAKDEETSDEPVFLNEAIALYLKEIRHNDIRNTENYVEDLEDRVNKLPLMLEAVGHKHFKLSLLKDNKKIIQHKKLARDCRDELAKQPGRKSEFLSPFTVNGTVSHWSMLIKWLNDNYGMQLYNPFTKLKLTEEYTPLGIEDKEFNKLISWMKKNPKLPKHTFHVITNKDLNWLRCTYLLQRNLPMAVRREDVLVIKWCDILIEDNMYFIKVMNHKKTRKNKLFNAPVYDYHPITFDVLDVLKELGFGKKQDPNDYIIMGTAERAKYKRTQSRERLKKKLSVSFPFLTMLCLGVKIQNKAIRKENFTGMEVMYGGTEGLHANQTITDKFYSIRLKKAKLLAAKRTDVVQVKPKSKAA